MSTFGHFIAEHVDAIVDDFEAFARMAGPCSENLDSQALRDHAKVVLEAVAADIETVQTSEAQHLKATGRLTGELLSKIRQTSRLHATHRFEQGFTLPEMVSEYRALRASVIQRWMSHRSSSSHKELLELSRFGEAIDEGLTEAVSWYSSRLEDSRNLLIGVLAHDLRSPLSAVQLSANYLLRSDRLLDGDLRAATRIAASAARMAGYIYDLLDFTRTLLGASLPIVRSTVDLRTLCEDVVDEVRAAHPTATVNLQASDNPRGQWDAGRLVQMLTNLIANAIIHGAADRPVSIQVAESEEGAIVTVQNEGEPIPPDRLPTLFLPLQQSSLPPSGQLGSSGMGLGLYIARQIAVAHGGTIDVASEVSVGTTFTVRLPLA